MPYTVKELQNWTPVSDTLPDEAVFKAAFYDLSAAAKAKEHTKLGTRLNYEQTGISSTFRKSGRALSKPGKTLAKEFASLDPRWKKSETFFNLFITYDSDEKAFNRNLLDRQLFRLNQLKGEAYKPPTNIQIAAEIAAALPLTAREYGYWALFTSFEKNKDFTRSKVTEVLYVALVDDLQNAQNKAAINRLNGPFAELLKTAAVYFEAKPRLNYEKLMTDVNKNWGYPVVWETIKLHSPVYTNGYFLNAVDMRKTADGPAVQPENKQILLILFQRTVKMSLSSRLAAYYLLPVASCQQPAFANIQSANDTCSAAILDIIVGQNISVESDAATTGRNQ